MSSMFTMLLPDDVANRHIGGTGQRRGQRGDKFGRRRADGDYR